MIIFWVISMFAMVIFGFFGSIVIITTAYKRKKLDLMLLGFLTFLMVFIPILSVFIGIDIQQYIKLSNELYWSIFAFLAFCITFDGITQKTRDISLTGGTMTCMTIIQLALFFSIN
ncbi:hypothetical protein CN679_28045 [Bacillus pseudomycoides]|nr:hypothetical protein CN679_28045 [Bacillus pseudomycoides]